MNINENFKNVILQSSLFLYLISVFFIQNSTLNLNNSLSTISTYVKVVFLAICMVSTLFFNKYRIREIPVIIFLCIPLFITNIITGNSPLLDLLLIVIGMRSVPLTAVLRIFLSTHVLSFISIIMLRFLNFIPDRVLIREGILRNSLGFWHPNTTGLVLLSIFLLSLLLFSKYKYSIIIVFNVANVTLYEFTNSRTAFLLIFFASFLIIIEPVMGRLKINLFKFRYFIPIVFVLLMIMSYTLSYLYILGNPFIHELSQLLSNRISLGSSFVQEYDASFFGRVIQYNSPNFSTQEVIGFQYRVLDNVYLKYYLNYGIFSILFLLFYLIAISRRLADKYLVSWNMYLLIFLIYGLIEQSAFNFPTNFFLIFGIIIMNTNVNSSFLKKIDKDFL